MIGRHGGSFKAGNIDETLSVELIGAALIAVRTRRGYGFWFLGLPRNKGDKSDVIEACLSLNQLIMPVDKTGRILSASNVHVSYFKNRESGKYEILESWHFDYAPDKAGHPVFHAQLTEDHMPPSSSRCEYKPKRRVPALKGLPRVPTPPLGLAAVMEIIIADHMIDYHEIADSKDWESAASGLPQLPMTHLASWRLSVDKLKARHWYPAA